LQPFGDNLARKMTKMVEKLVHGHKIRVKIKTGDTAEKLFYKSGFSDKCCFVEFVEAIRRLNRGFAWGKMGGYLIVPNAGNGVR